MEPVGITAAVTAVATIVIALLKWWAAGAPDRAKKEHQDDDEKLREECESLDAGAISARIDGVLNPATNSARVRNSGTEAGADRPQ